MPTSDEIIINRAATTKKIIVFLKLSAANNEIK